MTEDSSQKDVRAARATRPLAPRIAVVFDFDDTLAHDSFDLLFEELGQDPDYLKHDRMQDLYDEGWEEAMAHIHVLAELDRNGEAEVTRETLARVGREATLMPGVDGMFDRLRQVAREHDDRPEGDPDELDVEFHVCSAGLTEVIEASRIADELSGIWACACHFEDGHVRGAKRVVTYAEKAHYLHQLARGLTEERGNPADPYLDVPEHELYIPPSQIVYVGDGASDMPAFAYTKDKGGVAIGVYESEEAADWDVLDKVHGTHRVDNLAPADFREGSELMRSLELAVASVARRVALRRLGRGE